EDVGVYIRVSTDDQVGEDKFGLSIQLDEIKDYCSKKEFHIIKIYEDAGVSGAEQNRPALNDMLEDAKNNMFQKVIVAKFDRLARELYLQLFIEKELLIHEVEIFSVREQFSGKDPVMVMMRQMMGVFAQFEKNRIAERLNSGRLVKRDKGGYIGGQPPLGYYSIKGSKKLFVNEEKTEVIIEAFRLKGKMSLKQIANKLNEDGYSTRDDKPFSPMQVKRLYDREHLYKGYMEAPPILKNTD
ncbi:hypothetical protein DXT76_10760, partial [Halobacillus trueperi]